MDIPALQRTLEAYESWYLRNEEKMTLRESDRYWDKGEELKQYIESRKLSEGENESTPEEDAESKTIESISITWNPNKIGW